MEERCFFYSSKITCSKSGSKDQMKNKGEEKEASIKDRISICLKFWDSCQKVDLIRVTMVLSAVMA